MSSLYLRMAGAFGVALILAGCAAKARRHHGGQARGTAQAAGLRARQER